MLMSQPERVRDDRCTSVTPVVSSGGDDRRVLLWHMEKAIHGRSKPVKLKGEHRSNIFCLAFDSSNAKVFSGGESRRTETRTGTNPPAETDVRVPPFSGNDEQVILHDVERWVEQGEGRGLVPSANADAWLLLSRAEEKP